MTTVHGPSAVAVRRTGLGVVLVACAVATAAQHDDALWVFMYWATLCWYLTLCAEPLRRVVRTAQVSWAMATTYVATSVVSVGYLFTTPVDDVTGTRPHSVTVLGALVGHRYVSPEVASRFATASWILFALGLVGTVALWGQVFRLARRSEWAAIDNSVGDGSLATAATLDPPLGTSVTRPVPSPGRRVRYPRAPKSAKR